MEGVSGGGASEERRRHGGVASVESGTPVTSAPLLDTLAENPQEEIVMPHNSPLKKAQTDSPQKRLCSSFLGRDKGSHTSPRRPHPLSPGSKALDQVLNRIKSMSPGKGDGLVRRKLAMVEQKEVVRREGRRRNRGEGKKEG